MRHVSIGGKVLCVCFALVAGWCVAPAAAYDLTGIWRDDHGSRYVMRQAGDEFCWSFEPINVFCGTMIGDVIAGSWLDLPTGPYHFSGHLVLRVESPDRLVKVYETMGYGGSVWTREGSATAGLGTPANPSSPPVAAAPPPSPPVAAPPPPPRSETSPATADEKGGTKDWTYRAIDYDYRGRIGARIEFTCKPDDKPVEWRALYGTGTYTGDSVLCQAAVHDGKITAAGGKVVVEIRPGQASYTGSSQNGVISASYGAWDISFGFVPPETRQVNYDSGGARPSAGARSQPADASSELIDGGTIALTDAVAFKLRGQYGTRVRVTCPAGGSDIGYLWGTDVYTDDSMTCSAAVHAGLITFAKGGTVTLEIRPGQSSYQGSARFGITSRGFGGYEGSFVFVH